MKGKIVTLILMLCFLTGCDANYKLEYVNNSFNESFSTFNLSGLEEEVKSVYNFDLSTNYLDVSDYSKEEGLAEGYTYYEKNLQQENGLILSYQYNFSEDNYINSQIARMLFPNMHFVNNELKSGKISDIYLRYPDLNNITIEFKSDKFISNNNADDIKNNVYYWYINKNNYENKEINITFSEEDGRDIVEILQDEAKELDKNDYNKISKNVFIGLGVILFIISIFVFIKFKNSNKK